MDAPMHSEDGSEGGDLKRKRVAQPSFTKVRDFKRSKSEPPRLGEPLTAMRAAEVMSRLPLIPFVPQPQGPYINSRAMAMVRDQLCELAMKHKGMKASMQEMREAVVGDLFQAMKTRQVVLEQLGGSYLPEEIKPSRKAQLEAKKQVMIAKEGELLNMEKLLSGFEAVLQFADAACVELEEKIQMFDLEKSWEPNYLLSDLPKMTALARLTGGGAELGPEPMEIDSMFDSSDEPSFTIFMKLPFEIRLQIWEWCLPGPRIVIHDARHNEAITILRVCRESRRFVEKKYIRFLSPGAHFPMMATSSIYINPKIDTVVRDLSVLSGSSGSLFELRGPAFSLRCFSFFSGLAKVQHLALGFDLLTENGGQLFGPLQVCCPDLKTLTIFPSCQLRVRGPRHDPHTLRFLEFDSNFCDYIAFRWDRCRDRTLKMKAIRGLSGLEVLAGHDVQYKDVFPEYIELFGQDWNPILKICFLTKWNEACQGWQTRYLDTDRYSRGFPGDDGKLYRGFIEAGMICDAEGDVKSRYDGIRELFGNMAL